MKPNLRLLNRKRDPNLQECLDPLRQNERRRTKGLSNPGPSARLTVTLAPLPDSRAKAKVRATRASRRRKAKGRTPRVKAMRLLGDGMFGTAPTYVTRIGRVTAVDGMSTCEQFNSLFTYSAGAEGNWDGLTNREYQENRCCSTARQYHCARCPFAYSIPCLYTYSNFKAGIRTSGKTDLFERML